MEAPDPIASLSLCKGRILKGRYSLSCTKRLERHEPAASGFRRSER